MTNEKVYQTEWLGRTLTIKTGKMALQADAAVTVQYGDSVVMATVVQSNSQRDGIDYFPLMVDFEEKLYAAGIIKGSRWIKREGRPSDESVLTGRMIDRSIRPLFDDSSRKDVQVILSVLSVDQENDYDIISLLAASAALSISGIDWKGPIGGIRVGKVDGQFVFNPTYEAREGSDLDLIVAGTPEKVIMIESGSNEVPEDEMFEAIMAGQNEMAEAVALIEKFKKENAPAKKAELTELKSAEELEEEKKKEEALKTAENWLKENIKQTLFNKEYYTKGERKGAVKAIKENLDKFLFDQGMDKKLRSYAISKLAEKMIEAEVTNGIINEKKRVDGRALDEIRDLKSEVALLPRTHGSSLFSRGETQVMSIVTLGAPGLEQSLEGLEGKGTKRFMHHYNFPPYSVGEARPMRGPGRRDIGHGALAEKALSPLIPEKEDFPYTIRVVSETLGSNGSSSMASTCAASLALMDAGVPTGKAVAGVAMGLASNEDLSKWEVLTDIQDLEDGKGGMDFKVAGTKDGITAIQLDTKTDGITKEIIEKTLNQGREARLRILDVMGSAIPEPREELSQYAPRVTTFKIDPEKIREVIGAGGKVINEIIDECEVEIDIEDDGTVFVCGTDAIKSEKAINWIKDIARIIEPGEIFAGKVVRLLDFGAFVEFLPGRDGMVHVSEIGPFRLGQPSDLLSPGDTVTVKVKEIDDQGRVNLTMNGLKENEHIWKKFDPKKQAPRNNGFNNRSGGGRDRGGFNRR